MYPLFVVQGFTACRWGVIPDIIAAIGRVPDSALEAVANG